MSRPTAAQWGAGNRTAPYQFTEMYSYLQGGAVSRKRLTMTAVQQAASLDTTQTYDNEDKALTVKYPDTQYYGGSGLATQMGPTYAYSYDTQGRPSGLVDNQANPVTWVNKVQYGPAGELRQLSYGVGTGMLNGAPQSSGLNTETRTYNSLYQMTNVSVTGVLSMTYQYSATQNNGQITQQMDGISGEQVSYAYDNLNRLIGAATADTSWGLSFSYDGFGNRTGSTVTKGQRRTDRGPWTGRQTAWAGTATTPIGTRCRLQGAGH